MKSASTLLVAALMAVASGVISAEPAAPDDSFSRRQVLPLLQKRCHGCHSHAGDIEGGLALDSKSGWEQGGDSGPAIFPQY